jgi:hypothetical protein
LGGCLGKSAAISEPHVFNVKIDAAAVSQLDVPDSDRLLGHLYRLSAVGMT